MAGSILDASMFKYVLVLPRNSIMIFLTACVSCSHATFHHLLGPVLLCVHVVTGAGENHKLWCHTLKGGDHGWQLLNPPPKNRPIMMKRSVYSIYIIYMAAYGGVGQRCLAHNQKRVSAFSHIDSQRQNPVCVFVCMCVCVCVCVHPSMRVCLRLCVTSCDGFDGISDSLLWWWG